MANAKVPNRALINSRYLVGHVYERIAKKKCAQYPTYKVAFEYSYDNMKELEFTLEEIVGTMILNNHIKGLSKKLTNDINEKENVLHEQSNIESIYGFNADDVEGEALESDDEFEEDKMKHIRQQLNEGNCYFGNLKSDEEKKQFVTGQLKDCFCKDKISTLECYRGLTWKKNEEIEAPSGLLPDRKSYLKDQYKNKFKTEIESLLAFLSIPFGFIGSVNQYKDITLDE